MQRGRHRRHGAVEVSNVRNDVNFYPVFALESIRSQSLDESSINVAFIAVMVSVDCRLYEKLGEHDQAAASYADFVADEFRNVDRKELSHAYIYLTQYHLKKKELDQANHYAQKCLQFDETKEEAKVLLRTIAEKRAKVEETSMVVSKRVSVWQSLRADRDSISRLCSRWTT